MSRSVSKLVVTALVTAAALLGAGVGSASAVVLPTGTACAGFPVRVDSGVDSRNVHEFKDAQGNVVRVIVAGRADAVTLTNENTGFTYSIPARGSKWDIVNHSDGTSTYTTSGHLLLILFPTDVPAGPSSTLYTGQVVFNVSASGDFTLLRHKGTATDLCAALAG